MNAEDTAALKFPVPFWPLGPLLAIAFMVFVIAVLGYFPGTRTALGVGVVWIALLCLAYRLWVHPKRPGDGDPLLVTQGAD